MSAAVPALHSKILLWSRGLLCFEEHLFAERGDLLSEWFAADALVRCDPVASDMECRQRPSRMSHKPLQDRAVEGHRRTDLSFCEILDCTNLSLDCSIGSIDARLGVAVSDKTFFVNDSGQNVCASFVFDVRGAWLLVALWYHFLMTRLKASARQDSTHGVGSLCPWHVSLDFWLTRQNKHGSKCRRLCFRRHPGTLARSPSASWFHLSQLFEC